MSQSFTNLIYHIILSTKDRQPLITPEDQPRLYDYIGGIIRGTGGISLRINGIERSLARQATTGSRAFRCVARPEGQRQRVDAHIFPELKHFTWQRGYGAFTVSQSRGEDVQRYIAMQKEHHATLSFRDEFIRFLSANGIEFDEHYL